ncbi:hypothetical protein ABI59_12250 [Acidobacteria bacterium Mor1]|nr:hypothetical protein ABI59_12250 [Acidobacteria bacterium Mor1]
MWWRVLLALLVVAVAFVALAGTKVLQIGAMIEAGESFVPPPVAVGIAAAETEEWVETLGTVGSVAAVEGITVRNEIPGVVQRIAFQPGGRVSRGDLLVELDSLVEQANLKQAQADLALAERQIKRARELFATQTIPESDLDQAIASEAEARARVASLQATLLKKTIRAPFAGRLGIKQISTGQYLDPGDPIVELQAIDRVFVEFSLPQQALVDVEPGLPVRVQGDAFDGELLGKITAINPQIDSASRNLRLQATFVNRDAVLRPGMYVNVDVILPRKREVVIVPTTSVMFAPFGNTVFIVEEADEGGLVARQQIVRLGDTQGDFIEITEGLAGGERVVSAGAFKLRNGQAIVESDLGLIPPSKTPTPPDS